MNKKNVTLVILTCIVVFIFILRFRRRDMYTNEQAGKLIEYFRGYDSSDNGILMKTITNIALNDLDKNETLELSNVNALIDIMNMPQNIPARYDYTQVPSVLISPARTVTYTQMDHYPDTTSLGQMFQTAYTSGESGLTPRDRIVLRALAWPALALTQLQPLLTFTYRSDGVPDFTDTIVSESGKSTKDMLVYCFKIISMLMSQVNDDTAQNPYTPEAIDYINSTLPDRFSPKFDRTNNMSIINAMQAETKDDKTTWFLKALLIGPAYIAWLAENKWRLDPDWVRT